MQTTREAPRCLHSLIGFCKLPLQRRIASELRRDASAQQDDIPRTECESKTEDREEFLGSIGLYELARCRHQYWYIRFACQ